MKTNIFYSQKDALVFALEEIKKKIKEEYDFFVFSFHPKYDCLDIGYFVNKVFNTSKWVGFYSLDAFADEKVVSGVVLLAIKFEKEGNINIFEIDDIEEKGSIEKTVEYFSSNKDKLHIIISSLCNDKIGFFVKEVGDRLSYFPINNIVGGIASGIRKENNYLTYVFTPEKVIKNGFIVISFANVEFEVGIALGFKPYGVIYEIKKAEKSKIYEVDNGKKFSSIIKNLTKGIENFRVEHLWYCPINILDDEKGYVATLRIVKEINENYVDFFGPVEKGEKFKFSFAENEELLEEDKKVALKIKEKMRHPDLILNFSCVARQYVLEEKREEENKIYINVLNTHLFGFFTFGEIGPDIFFKSLKYYNDTSLLVAIKE